MSEEIEAQKKQEETEIVAKVGVPQRPDFVAKRGVYTKMTLVGTILSVITLGIYRGWFITNLRRYIWSHTVFDGDSFEYHGRGIELLVGFLVAVVITMPFFVLAQVGPFLFSDTLTFGLFLLAYYMFLLFFIQYAMYRGRAYRLSRTSWRGIRFRQSGSGWHYAFISFLWILVTLCTLGIAYPWMRIMQMRYRVNNSWFGSQQATFEGDAKEYITTYLKAYGILCVCGLAMLSMGPLSETTPFWQILLAALAIGSFVLLYVGIPYLIAREFKIFISKIRLCGARATIDMKARVLYGYVALYIAMLSLILFIFWLVMSLLMPSTLAALSAGSMHTMGFEFIIAIVIVYFVFILAATLIYAYFLEFPILRYIIENITVYNADSIIAAAATDDDTTGVSAGLADSLGFEFGY